MIDHLRAYPMVVLLIPVVAAILLWRFFSPSPPSDEEEHAYPFVLQSMPKSTAKCVRYKARVLPRGEVFLYILRDSACATPPQYGDTIVAYTRIEREGTIARAFVSRYLLLPSSDPNHTPPLQWRLYRRLSEAGLSGEELATVGALTLGYKDDIDPEVRRAFQASGAAHVLAVSGLHTGIIYALLIGLLTLGGRYKPLHEDRIHRCTLSLIIIGAMWGYAWLTGMTPSVVRAVLMLTLVEIGHMLYRRAFSLNTIAAAAVLILFVQPTDLFSVSFQLSFAATAAIVLLVNKILPRYYGSNRSLPTHGVPGALAKYISGLVVVSLAAQIGTLPITLYTFGQFSTYFLLTNMIVLPLATLLVPCGMLSIALGGTAPGLMVGKLTNCLAWFLNYSVQWIESWPFSTVEGHINGLMVGIYYIIIVFFIGLFAFSKKKQ